MWVNLELLPYICFTLILVVAALAGHASRGFKYATEGSVAMLVGTTVTGLLSAGYYAATRHSLPHTSLRLPDSVFFHILLPPIIFYAGFSLKKRMFFRNFKSICAFGFAGTLASAALISAGASAVLAALGLVPRLRAQTAAALGAICACSDTVAILQVIDRRAYPVLHSIVFGEGLVNDAVGVVLLGAVNTLSSAAGHSTSLLDVALLAELLLRFAQLFVYSTLLGVGCGLLSALLVRHVFGRHHDCDREVLLLGLLGFFSYLLADAAGLSAILAVFFCGITMSHYTWHNLGPAAQALAIHTFRVAAGLNEMILFAYSGVTVWTSALWQQPADSHRHLQHALSLASVLLLAIVIARVAFVFPMAALLNWSEATTWLPWRRQQQQQLWQPSGRHLSLLDSSVITWGGLSRGAITLALAFHFFSPEAKHVATEDHQVMILAVVIVVLVSTLVLGTITGPLMEYIMQQHKQQQQQQQVHSKRDDGDEGPAVLRAPLLPRHHGNGASAAASDASSEAAQAAAAPAGDTAAAAATGHALASSPFAAAAGEHVQQLPLSALLRQQQLLLWQQLGHRSSFNGESVGLPPLPATPSGASDDPSIGTFLALSSSPAASSLGAGTGRLQPLAEQGQQQRIETASGQQMQQQACLWQQLRLLQQLVELQTQQEQQQDGQQDGQEQQQDGQEQQQAGWNLHSTWRWLDVRYLQPLFGGRQVAARTTIPRGFEDFGVAWG